MSYPVEGVTWELSGGLYETVWPVGYRMAYFANKYLHFGRKTDTALPPQRIIHTGIIYQGHVYEYCNEGVKKTLATPEGDPGSTCAVNRFLKREHLGNSKVSLRKFDSWVAEQKKGKFVKEKYCVAYNHCVHFAIAAASFLGVKHHKDWDQMCKFTHDYPTISKLANGSTNISSGAAAWSSSL